MSKRAARRRSGPTGVASDLPPAPPRLLLFGEPDKLLEPLVDPEAPSTGWGQYRDQFHIAVSQWVQNGWTSLGDQQRTGLFSVYPSTTYAQCMLPESIWDDMEGGVADLMRRIVGPGGGDDQSCKKTKDGECCVRIAFSPLHVAPPPVPAPASEGENALAQAQATEEEVAVKLLAEAEEVRHTRPPGTTTEAPRMGPPEETGENRPQPAPPEPLQPPGFVERERQRREPIHRNEFDRAEEEANTLQAAGASLVQRVLDSLAGRKGNNSKEDKEYSERTRNLAKRFGLELLYNGQPAYFTWNSGVFVASTPDSSHKHLGSSPEFLPLTVRPKSATREPSTKSPSLSHADKARQATGKKGRGQG